MRNILLILTYLIAGALTLVSAGIMHRFFGWVGVGLLIVFLLPWIAIGRYLNRRGSGSGGGGATRGVHRQSKGARLRDR